MTTSPAPTIRPLQPSDEAEWRRLWTAYLDFYNTSAPEEVYQTLFSRLLSDDPASFSCFVADAGDRLVGLTHYVFHPHAWNINEVCYLQDLYADPDSRGTGVGRALIEAVYQAADARKAANVYWLTQDSNETARRLYDRIGKLPPFLRYQRG
ncbi:GNAT family N-acetyltransferase [Phaeobacter sp. PT47_59]|uniref:GNAT family N-acetyltransferase n=1 Tax=Phaeobacter sp. PT47_59 TaxID=3029979 RepID=UPI002380BB30|nr:GNAT family N-acetyltransferase [Phaeobacter sp. PT47_59]MDE4175166.1 GNAT family N-acetyltransferase [Phaeobacter sp. PT47_59]